MLPFFFAFVASVAISVVSEFIFVNLAQESKTVVASKTG